LFLDMVQFLELGQIDFLQGVHRHGISSGSIG
jgi:hypothetical protein